MENINTNPQNVNIIPFQKNEIVENKQEYIDAIQHWCQTRDVAETLSRQEIGAMKAFDRIDAQRKAIIIHLTQYYRDHKRADVAPGVLVIMTLLSDNDKGSCALSQRTLADLFGCHESTIRDAQSRLKDCGAIVMGRGRYAENYPVIPRIVTREYNHLVWTIAALSSSKPSNVPTIAADCQSADNSSGLNQSADNSSGLKPFNPPTKANSIRRQKPPLLLHYKELLYNAHAREDNVENREHNFTAKTAAGIFAAGLAAGVTTLPAAANTPEPPAIVQELATRLSSEELTNRLLDAGGAAMANLANSPGLIVMSEPQRWLEHGCDLEKDIIPTIKAVTARRKPGTIRAWEYFTQAIVDAKTKRLTPLPENKSYARTTYEDDFRQRERDWLSRQVAESAKRFAGKEIKPRSEQ